MKASKTRKRSGKARGKIYLAGKVTGQELSYCVSKFAVAEYSLISKGWRVVNPLRVVGNPNTEWHLAMRKCLAALLQCDAICMLEDWQDSAGAKLEHNLAAMMRIEIYYQNPMEQFKDKNKRQ